MSEKSSAFWQNFLAGLCTNCFRPVHGFILRSFLKRKSDTFYRSRKLSKAFSGIQSKIFQQGCQKKLSKLLIISGHWAKIFNLLWEKLQQCCQNCMLRVHRNSLNEFFFWKKVFSFFYINRTGSEKKLAFYQLFYNGVSKSVFHVSMGTFRRKIFSINLNRFSIFFQTMTGKKIRLSVKLFFGRVEKLHFTSLWI